MTTLKLDATGAHVIHAGRTSIRGLHVTGDGHGAAVGDAGTFLLTANGGASWIPRPLPLATRLRSLDQPFHPH
jgi:photosystem II stability/assembly factor-like uncharacterized protein